ncbi:MAG: D-alanine--D-alanine ligase [Gammaproteobacteria bacterium]
MKRLPPPLITDPGEFGKVAVLMGGWSAERAISLQTGEAVLNALKHEGVDAYAVDPRDNFQDALGDGEFDRAFIALHGRGGEDGTIQGALEFLKLPYTGSGVLGSAISMDKVRTKQLFEASGLATPGYFLLESAEHLNAAADKLGFPLAVKPAREGSSIGLSKVTQIGELAKAFDIAHALDKQVLLEQWIEGPEYTAAVINDQVLPMIRIETPKVFYNYEAKYFSDDTQYHCPCGLDDEVEARYAEQVLQAFEATSAKGWGRVDFMTDEHGKAYMLEVNTVPGMTATSLVPMAAKQLGCSFEQLVWRVLETSLIDVQEDRNDR